MLLGLGVISVVAFAATATNWSQLANKSKSEGGDLVTEFYVLRDKVKDLNVAVNNLSTEVANLGAGGGGGLSGCYFGGTALTPPRSLVNGELMMVTCSNGDVYGAQCVNGVIVGGC